MTEIKKAPARTGANANTVVIAPFTKAIMLLKYYTGVEFVVESCWL